ncbi:antA/AntB antirepressor family protein [Solidesulfovibrio sp.]
MPISKVNEAVVAGNTAISAQLVPVVANLIGESEVPTVNARELHGFLKVKTAFKDWIARRIEEYEFEEGKDFCSILGKSTGGRPTKDFHLTLDTAKEISMVEKTPEGRMARRYFIECERRVFASARPSADLSKLTTVSDRRPLKALVDAWVAAAKANGKFLAHTEAFRIARTPVGGRKMKELTLTDIPVAMAYVQEQLERELAAASPMAVAAEQALALPPATPDPDLEAKVRRLRSLKQEMMDVSAEVYRVVKRGMRPRASDYGKPAESLAVNMNYLLDDVFYAMDRNLDAVEHLCAAGKSMPQALPVSAGAGR